MSFLEINEKDIQELSDVDLRALIGLLCEAELEQNGQPVTAAMWGGNQRAADGGLDVYVALGKPAQLIGELPRWKTGFQVKQESMSKGKIISEMAPKGEPRPVLAELAQDGGAYIIACGRETTSGSMLKSRLEGMQEVIDKVDGGEQLFKDFYDSNRIATWTRKHPSLVLWVRKAIGRPILGWKPYQNWANCPGGIDEEYLLDESLKLRDGVSGSVSDLTAEAGLTQIRTILGKEKECIRLVGLSGVGKTRFVQALFDSRVGEHCLSKRNVCYTDISDGPVPTPIEMAYQLVALKKRVVLIVDNCPPDLHNKLTEICTGSESHLSLLTVEYDIKEDLPENTDVFFMEPSSNDLLVKLITKRFVSVSWNVAEMIAEFSEGNARIAIAIAGTIRKGESALALKNGPLFERLFWQRNKSDECLLKAAEACSVVYSFDGKNVSESDGELARLSSLVGLSVAELFRQVEELFRRGLLQKRSQWRAVLPQAISDRLARRALDNIPVDLLERKLNEDQSGRLLKSFSKRLGYLHDSNVAVEIAKKWLSANGLLGDITNLSGLGIALFSNIAAVSPDLTLEAIERAANGEHGKAFTCRDNRHHTEFIRLLRQIAYDPNLFERCCDLLSRYVASEGPNEKNDSTLEVLTTLFYIHYSGTHASLEQRLGVITSCSQDSSSSNWIVEPMVRATLRTTYFRTYFGFKFGARSRDYGAYPKNAEETRLWYRTAIQFAKGLALSELSVAPMVRRALAASIPGLWMDFGIQDELVDCIRAISSKVFWEEGWIALRKVLYFNKEKLKGKSKTLLLEIEKELAPVNLVQSVKAYAFTGNGMRFDLADAEDDDEKITGYERVALHTEELGRKLATDHASFNELLPECLLSDSNRLLQLGCGLGVGTIEPSYHWNNFKVQLARTPIKQRNVLVLQGFLIGASKEHSEWVSATLNEAVECGVLGIHFPRLQSSVTVDDEAVQRLKKSLDLSVAPIESFHGLAYCLENLNDDKVAELLESILNKPEGEWVALDILHSYIWRKNKEINQTLKRFGQKLSVRLVREKDRREDDYKQQKVIEMCFASSMGEPAARALCKALVEATNEGVRFEFNSSHIMNPLMKVQPHVVLDELLLGHEDGKKYFSRRYSHRENTMSVAPIDSVLAWCNVDPRERYSLVSSVTALFEHQKQQDSLKLSPLALAILDNAPDEVGLLKGMGAWQYPSVWSGSLAALLSARVPFLKEFLSHEKKSVREWAAQAMDILKTDIERERKYEEGRDKDRYESFE